MKISKKTISMCIIHICVSFLCLLIFALVEKKDFIQYVLSFNPLLPMILIPIAVYIVAGFFRGE